MPYTRTKYSTRSGVYGYRGPINSSRYRMTSRSGYRTRVGAKPRRVWSKKTVGKGRRKTVRRRRKY